MGLWWHRRTVSNPGRTCLYPCLHTQWNSCGIVCWCLQQEKHLGILSPLVEYHDSVDWILDKILASCRYSLHSWNRVSADNCAFNVDWLLADLFWHQWCVVSAKVNLFSTRSLWGPTPIVPGILIRLHSDLNTKSQYIDVCLVGFKYMLWTIKDRRKKIKEGRVAKVLLVSLATFGRF